MFLEPPSWPQRIPSSGRSWRSSGPRRLGRRRRTGQPSPACLTGGVSATSSKTKGGKRLCAIFRGFKLECNAEYSTRIQNTNMRQTRALRHSGHLPALKPSGSRALSAGRLVVAFLLVQLCRDERTAVKWRGLAPLFTRVCIVYPEPRLTSTRPNLHPTQCAVLPRPSTGQNQRPHASTRRLTETATRNGACFPAKWREREMNHQPSGYQKEAGETRRPKPEAMLTRGWTTPVAKNAATRTGVGRWRYAGMWRSGWRFSGAWFGSVMKRWALVFVASLRTSRHVRFDGDNAATLHESQRP